MYVEQRVLTGFFVGGRLTTTWMTRDPTEQMASIINAAPESSLRSQWFDIYVSPDAANLAEGAPRAQVMLACWCQGDPPSIPLGEEYVRPMTWGGYNGGWTAVESNGRSVVTSIHRLDHFDVHAHLAASARDGCFGMGRVENEGVASWLMFAFEYRPMCWRDDR